jgi:hypothetical protein
MRQHPGDVRTMGSTRLFAASVSARSDVAPRLSTSLLRVRNIALSAPGATETRPGVVLTFDVLNDGSVPLTDFVLEISIADRLQRAALTDRASVRPFTIRGRTVLHAGYTMRYEMLLRNLEPTCDCIATIDVVSVRWLIDRTA